MQVTPQKGHNMSAKSLVRNHGELWNRIRRTSVQEEGTRPKKQARMRSSYRRKVPQAMIKEICGRKTGNPRHKQVTHKPLGIRFS